MKDPEIAIIDYGLGNIKSISGAIINVGGRPRLTRNKKEILNSDGLILPGVGAFANAIEKIYDYDLVDPIRDFAGSNKPILGICLGMQLLFEKSEEFGLTKGLGFIKGDVVKLPIDAKTGEKLPHIKWGELYKVDGIKWDHTILNGIANHSSVYFVHSYICRPVDKLSVVAVTKYGGCEFCSVVKENNIYGCQFHLEKSATAGLAILRNFLKSLKGRYE